MRNASAFWIVGDAECHWRTPVSSCRRHHALANTRQRVGADFVDQFDQPRGGGALHGLPAEFGGGWPRLASPQAPGRMQVLAPPQPKLTAPFRLSAVFRLSLLLDAKATAVRNYPPWSCRPDRDAGASITLVSLVPAWMPCLFSARVIEVALCRWCATTSPTTREHAELHPQGPRADDC